MIMDERPFGVGARSARLAAAALLLLLAAGCAGDPEPVVAERDAPWDAAARPAAMEPQAAASRPAGEPSLDEQTLRDLYVAHTAEYAMAEMIVRECPIFRLNEHAVTMSKNRLALETAKTYGYDPQAITAAPLTKRIRNFQADPELRTLVARRMVERSRINDLYPDNPESICSAGHYEMDEKSSIGGLLLLRE